MFELAIAFFGLLILAVPILLILLFVALSNSKSRWRHLESRFQALSKAFQELQSDTRELEQHLEHAGLLPTESRDQEVEEEQPSAEGPIHAPYRPYPSATPAPANAAPAERPPAAAPAPPATSAPITAAPTPPATAATARPAAPRPPSALDKWRQQLSEQLAGEGWEAVIGGSWLNKIGSLVTVVGIALILSWSWANLGPAGRVAMALALSLSLLVFGVVLERRRGYVTVARGFIGAGWAALYVTAYAMHGIEAARIIDDPLWGFVLLLAVAVGMILHSLQYRSQTVTGLAYFIAFATLTLTPLTQYAWFASLPLAASLLYLAYRVTWPQMAVMGLVVTYGTFLFRVGGLEASDPLLANWSVGQGILILYWVLFEAFDLLRVAKLGPELDITETVFPLNAAGFLGISLMEWSTVSPETLYAFLAMAGGAFTVSAFLRGRLRPASAFPEGTDTLKRALMGGYEGAVTLAAALVAAGIWERYTGLRVGGAWLLEAEIIFLIGLQLRQPFLRWLASVVVVLPVVKLIGIDIHQRAVLDVMETEIFMWVPLALLIAAVLYLNRALVEIARDLEVVPPERGYTYVATALVIIVLGHEVPPEYVGLSWLLLALPLFETGLRSKLAELRYQAYGAAALGCAWLVSSHVFGLGLDVERPWLSLIPAALFTYAAAARLYRLGNGQSPESSDLPLPDKERTDILDLSSVAGTVALASLAWYVLPSPLVAVAWGLLGLLLIEVGYWLPLPSLRLQGHALAFSAFARTFLANFVGLGETAGISHRILTVVPLIGLYYYLASKLEVEAAIEPGARSENAAATGRSWGLASFGIRSAEAHLARIYLYLPVILAVVLIRFELGRVLAVIGWTVLAFVLMILGVRWNREDFRWQAYLLGVLVFARSWSTNFYVAGDVFGLPGRLATGALVVIGLYACQFVSPRRRDDSASDSTPGARGWLDVHSRTFFSLLATALLTLLLFYEVSGRLLTVAWTLEGTLLLLAGFALRERPLRLSGLVLLGACVFKAFAYDMQELDTIYKILSFIILGLLLLGVSLIYTRYKEQIRRYL